MKRNEVYMNEDYSEFLKKKNMQLIMLSDQIVGNTCKSGKKQIKVFPIEAGLGKTTTMIKSLLELHSKFPSIKTLIVTKRKDEARWLKEELGDIAIVVYSGNIPCEESILKTPVVIITHSRYKLFCNCDDSKYQAAWKVFSHGRRNLIIDEELELMKIISVSNYEYFMVRNSLIQIDSSLKDAFEITFSEVGDVFRSMDSMTSGSDSVYNRKFVNQEAKICYGKIIHRVEKTENNFDLYEALSYQHDEDCFPIACSYNELIDAIKKLEKLLDSKLWVFRQAYIHCVDTSIKYELLENNIILDASASMNPIYKNCDLFDVIPTERIIDHGNWNIRVCSINSSTSKKREYTGYYKRIMFQASKICFDKNNKLLIVGSKKDELRMKSLYSKLVKQYKTKISFSHYGAIRGKNKWSDYNCYLTTHKFIRPSFYYPLLLKYYMPDYPLKDSDLVMRNNVGKGDKAHYGYINCSLLDQIREGDTAAETYQAIKRINRSNRDKAEVYIITNNINTLYTLRTNMKGARFKKFMLQDQEAMLKTRELKKYTREEESPVRARLRNLFVEILIGKYTQHEYKPGYYKKKWCMQQIGYKGEHFYRYLNDLSVFMLENRIDKDKRNIIVYKYVKYNPP